MAEVGETPNAQPEAAQEREPIVVDQAPLTPSAPRESLFKKVLNLFSPKPKAPSESQQSQLKTEPQIRDEMAQKQAQMKNIEAFINSTDNTGSGKIQDTQRLEQLRGDYDALRAQLPSDQTQPTGESIPSPTATTDSSDQKAA